eukprot:gnl/MRDRNA2_/MRDRNA2_96199_c0_seq1.p1 gnl/MRDRNA2_/MRDRNA2_96199_c0~~gnl/MRDRNA2_/MRDRNA2_96199_c0_seq1.p1  ORF type:complete len:612 (+),score=96.38 gnl/MRDRNA2_/MRDRNA2_96199_c0_seq1:265-1836(+)
MAEAAERHWNVIASARKQMVLQETFFAWILANSHARIGIRESELEFREALLGYEEKQGHSWVRRVAKCRSDLGHLLSLEFELHEALQIRLMFMSWRCHVRETWQPGAEAGGGPTQGFMDLPRHRTTAILATSIERLPQADNRDTKQRQQAGSQKVGSASSIPAVVYQSLLRLQSASPEAWLRSTFIGWKCTARVQNTQAKLDRAVLAVEEAKLQGEKKTRVLVGMLSSSEVHLQEITLRLWQQLVAQDVRQRAHDQLARSKVCQSATWMVASFASGDDDRMLRLILGSWQMQAHRSCLEHLQRRGQMFRHLMVDHLHEATDSHNLQNFFVTWRLVMIQTVYKQALAQANERSRTRTSESVFLTLSLMRNAQRRTLMFSMFVLWTDTWRRSMQSQDDAKLRSEMVKRIRRDVAECGEHVFAAVSNSKLASSLQIAFAGWMQLAREAYAWHVVEDLKGYLRCTLEHMSVKSQVLGFQVATKLYLIHQKLRLADTFVAWRSETIEAMKYGGRRSQGLKGLSWGYLS